MKIKVIKKHQQTAPAPQPQKLEVSRIRDKWLKEFNAAKEMQRNFDRKAFGF